MCDRAREINKLYFTAIHVRIFIIRMCSVHDCTLELLFWVHVSVD